MSFQRVFGYAPRYFPATNNSSSPFARLHQSPKILFADETNEKPGFRDEPIGDRNHA
jgi:hypothetical protein